MTYRVTTASLLRGRKPLVHHKVCWRVEHQLLVANFVRLSLRLPRSFQWISAGRFRTSIHRPHRRRNTVRRTSTHRHQPHYGSGYRRDDNFGRWRRDRRTDGLDGNGRAHPRQEQRMVPWLGHWLCTTVLAVGNLNNRVGCAFDLEMGYLDGAVWSLFF